MNLPERISRCFGFYSGWRTSNKYERVAKDQSYFARAHGEREGGQGPGLLKGTMPEGTACETSCFV